MLKNCGRAVCCAVALLAAGCSQPGVALKPMSFQDSATNIRDWDAMAARIAQGMEDRGMLPGNRTALGGITPRDPMPYSQRPGYYVNVLDPTSVFLLELRDALQNEIEERGGIVARSPIGSVVVNLDVHVVRWGSVPTGIGESQTWFQQMLKPNMRAEAVWQATIASSDRVRLILRKPFYVFASDFPLYSPAPPSLISSNIPLQYSR